MICFIALIVFAVLGIFSAKYRGYFFEASDCIFRRVTLRKCTTSFDKKMKMKVTAGATKINKPFGGFVFRHFEVLSWILTISMIVSFIWSGYTGGVALYNWQVYGNCNGPDSNVACALNQISGKDPVTGAVFITASDINSACVVQTIK